MNADTDVVRSLVFVDFLGQFKLSEFWTSFSAEGAIDKHFKYKLVEAKGTASTQAPIRDSKYDDSGY